MEALVTSRYSLVLVALTICISALESDKSKGEWRRGPHGLMMSYLNHQNRPIKYRL